jgi:DNA helicase-2/ATP-dependent DNA helicase PcrA
MSSPRRKLNPAILAEINGGPPIPTQTAAIVERKAWERDRPKAFAPSLQQSGFFTFVSEGRGNAVLEAVAGAGKTTTLIHALPLMEGKIFFGAYNKSASMDIKAKAEKARANRPGLFISTLHAAGYGACRRAWGKELADPTDRKVDMIIDRLIADGERIQADPAKEMAARALAGLLQTNRSFVKKMVSFGKQFLMGVDFPKGHAIDADGLRDWNRIFDHFSMDAEISGAYAKDSLMSAMRHVFDESRMQCPRLLDFDDMIYAPIAFRLHLFQNDWVILDELQDTNLAREELAFRMLKSGGRFLGVGDDRQAIYGFSGAGGGGLDRIARRFNARRLPLTVTYRCPKSVVAFVQQWVDHIQAHPSAPEGCVRAPIVTMGAGIAAEQKPLPWYLSEALRKEDAILCRKTKPLIETAFALLRNSIACQVEGREIGKGLKTLASRWKITNLNQLEEKLKLWTARETEKALLAKSEKRAEEAADKFATLKVFMDNCRAQGKHAISDLLNEIDALFGDDVKGVITLCTGHKSKGREWPRVFWLQASQGRPLNRPWEVLEETNIKYVIATRAMQELILVPED